MGRLQCPLSGAAGLVARMAVIGSCRPCAPDGSYKDPCRPDSANVSLGFKWPLCFGSCRPCRPDCSYEGTEEVLHVGAKPARTPYERKIVSLRRTAKNNRLGMDVDRSDNMTLLIVDVRDGLVKQWNVEHPDDAVQKGDRIVEVNGVYGNAHAMLLALTEDSLSLSESLITIQRSNTDVANE